MDRWARHLTLATRRLLRSPLFAFTAILTLGVGIGANTAIFSVLNGVLLKPLPFEDSERLVALWHEAPGLGFDQLNQSPATYLTYRSDIDLLEDVAMWADADAQVTGLAEPEQVEILMVTDGFLELLRVDAARGRRFTAADDAPGAPPTVMLTHSYWERAFGGDPGAVGRTLQVDGEPREIIGILPQGFRFLETDPAFLYPGQFNPSEVFFGNFSYQGIGRLQAEATIEQVAAEVNRLIPIAVERYPGPIAMSMVEQAGFAALIRPLKEDVVGDVRAVLWVLLGTVTFILLIASANVANLFLVRAEGSQRDVAVRTAIGAGRGEIAGQFLGESLVLGAAGGLLGIAIAWGGLKLLLALAPADLPRLAEIQLDPIVLAFAGVISMAAGLLFGSFAWARYGRPNLVSSLKEGGRGGSQGKDRHRARNVLVVAQVALALVLLVGSGLMIRSFQALRNVDPGFDPENVLTLRVSIPNAVIESPEETVAAYEQMLRNLREIPGVTMAGGATAIPLGGWNSNDAVFVEDAPTPEGSIPPLRRFNWAMPGYFEAAGIPLLAGRDLEWDEVREGRPVVVVSENFAREYWDSPLAAIGRRVGGINLEGGTQSWHEIVGVVGNVREDGLDQEPTSAMYWPLLQHDFYGAGPELRRTVAFMVRAQPGALAGLQAQAREAAWRVTSSVPVAQVRMHEALVERSMARTSFTLVMLGIAAAVALLLGAVGIYGVISYAVSQRTREIGVRMALGAERSDVSSMVVRQGLMLAAIGVGLGLAAATGLTRLMSSLLFGVQPIDLPTYGAVSVVLAAVAMMASWLPARRAASIDPAITLRQE
jgi:predicted permease